MPIEQDYIDTAFALYTKISFNSLVTKKVAESQVPGSCSHARSRDISIVTHADCATLCYLIDTLWSSHSMTLSKTLFQMHNFPECAFDEHNIGAPVITLSRVIDQQLRLISEGKENRKWARFRKRLIFAVRSVGLNPIDPLCIDRWGDEYEGDVCIHVCNFVGYQNIERLLPLFPRCSNSAFNPTYTVNLKSARSAAKNMTWIIKDLEAFGLFVADISAFMWDVYKAKAASLATATMGYNILRDPHSSHLENYEGLERWCGDAESPYTDRLLRHWCIDACETLTEYPPRWGDKHYLRQKRYCVMKEAPLLNTSYWMDCNKADPYFLLVQRERERFYFWTTVETQLENKLAELREAFTASELTEWCDYSIAAQPNVTPDDFCIAVCHVLFSYGYNAAALKEYELKDTLRCEFGPDSNRRLPC